MFDHVTLRVADLATASSAFASVLDELKIEMTTSTPSLSVWGTSLSRRPTTSIRIARRVLARTPAHVERFAEAGIDTGFGK